MTAAERGVLIVGAGHAAGALAAALRQGGFEGPITLVGEEPLPPYQRPPLSKAVLKGEASPDTLLLRPAAFYADKSISLRLSARVVAVDRAARTASLDDGSVLGWDLLVFATGSRLRALPVPGVDARGVLELRTAADGARIREALAPGRRLVVVGGGYVGLEVAASARALGAEVVVVEREARLLARVASPALSAFFARAHAARGVGLELGATVAGFETAEGAIRGVRLADGRLLAADVAVVGIGALANDALALAAGLACQDGIVVDESARTSDPAVLAIGDCTNRPLPRYGRRMRLESVPNALEQAKQAAAAILGKPVPRAELPWFWSDQYDLRLQIAGLPFDVARTVVRGDPDAGRFVVFHLDADNRLQAVEAVNSPAEFMAARAWAAAAQVLDPDRAADPGVAVKQIPVDAPAAG
jgi:3-phenylpropionate/trans-cinnamate dioxygenase ferredoxin reductase subunit